MAPVVSVAPVLSALYGASVTSIRWVRDGMPPVTPVRVPGVQLVSRAAGMRSPNASDPKLINARDRTTADERTTRRMSEFIAGQSLKIADSEPQSSTF